MTTRDLIDVAAGNLWRKKLRATLTTAGVVIAIATFVAMLSFTAGNHRYFTTLYEDFGFLNQVSVRAKHSSPADTVHTATLDADAVDRIAAIPGVRLVYPYSTFSVTAAVADTVVTTTARSLPGAAVSTVLFQKVLGGASFSNENAHEAIVTQDFVEQTGIPADSLTGRRLIVSMRVASLDSALGAVTVNARADAMRLFASVDIDSLRNDNYVRRIVRAELGTRFSAFFDAFMNKRETVSDTLTITGVAPDDPEFKIRTAPIVISDGTARRLGSRGVVIDDNPANLLAAAQSGDLFDPVKSNLGRSYPRVTVEVDPLANHTAIKDSIETMGFRARSFADDFAEMQRFMLYYYMGMGVIGLIALATAALGIINTMIMSINERRREIGVLKSLGADEGTIKKLFLVESGVIGTVGSVAGIVLGWAGTRIVAAVARHIMAREDMPIFDPFALPLWLVALALGFGVLVSILAGLYPAARAARVDPVEALRSE